MKIAVCSENGEVFQHFGHTPEFLVCEVADGKVVSSEIVSSGGAGHDALAGLLGENKIDLLICGGIGGGAMAALAEAGVEVVGGVSGDAKVAVEAYLAGTLAPRADFKCKRTGYTADTLRFYEKAGLLPGVRRKGGRRVYTDEDY